MKCRLLREESTLPTVEYPGEWQCRACGASGTGPKLEKCPECGSVVGQRSGRIPAGTVLENDQAWLLVRMGVAVPADEECEKRAGLDPAQLAAAQIAQEKTRLGIHPEDYEAFDAGIMRGYSDDGSFIPGPNYEEHAWEERKRNSPLILENE